MPTYKVTDPTTGKTVRLEGDSPPTEQELEQIFSTIKLEKPQQQVDTLSPTDPLRPEKAALEAVSNIPSSAVNAVKTMVEGAMSLPQMAQSAFSKKPGDVWLKGEGLNEVNDLFNTVSQNLIQRYGSLQNIEKTLRTDPIGVLMDAGMFYGKVDPSQLIAKGASATGKALTQTLPQWGYKSALKMGTGKGLSVAERNRRAVTGLHEAIMPTEGGMDKLVGKIQDIEGQIQGPISEAAQQGVTVSRDAVAGRISPVAEKFASQVNPIPDIDAIAGVEKGFIETQPPRIPIDQAQQLKKGTYQQLKGKYDKPYGAAIESEKALARGLKEEVYTALEGQYPQLKALGEREGSLMALKDSIESAVKRIQNTEGMPLRGTIAATAGNAPITLASLLELPRVKAALSIALFKAGKAGKYMPKGTSKIPKFAYGVGQYMGDNNE